MSQPLTSTPDLFGSTPDLFGSATVGPYAEAMSQAVALLADRAGGVTRPRSTATLADLRALVAGVDLDRPLGRLDAALAEVGDLYLDHAVWFHDPGYLAHVNCPVAIPALAADVLASAVNTSVDTWDQSTTGTLIEQHLIAWTAGRLGFGEAADGVFTSGGTQSNLHALLLAREEVRARGGVCGAARGGVPGGLPGGVPGGVPGGFTRGAAGVGGGDGAGAGPGPGPGHSGGGRLRILATDQSHFSVARSARLLGLSGDGDGVVPVATDAARRMDPAALARALDAMRRAGDTPMAVVATAGTTDLGCIDPLPELAEICAAAGVWLHVDAAYGCGLLVSPTRRHLLAGIEHADSVTVDYHKSFFQPVSSSALLVRDGRMLRHGTTHADYLNPAGGTRPNQVDKSLQTTRRLDALKLWLTLRAMGADRVGELFDTVLDLAQQVHRRLVQAPDVEVAAAPTLSTLLFRWRPPGMDGAEAGLLAPLIRWALFQRGEALVAGTTLDGSGWLKISLLNPATTIADVERMVALVREAGAGLLAAEALARLDAAPPARLDSGVQINELAEVR